MNRISAYLGQKWRKSSYSAPTQDDCVELADLGRAVGIRDSKNPGGPALTVTRNGLAELVSAIRTA